MARSPQNPSARGPRPVLRSVRNLLLAVLCSYLFAALPAAAARAQSVSAESGTLNEISRPVSEGSRNVHERGNNIGQHSVGSMLSGPVRDGDTRSMLSGPVSEVSSGPMVDWNPMTGGGSQRQASSGAVKNELDRSVGEQLSNPRQLRALHEQLRALAAGQAAEEDADLQAAEDADAEMAHEIEAHQFDTLPDDTLQAETDGVNEHDGDESVEDPADLPAPEAAPVAQ